MSVSDSVKIVHFVNQDSTYLFGHYNMKQFADQWNYSCLECEGVIFKQKSVAY